MYGVAKGKMKLLECGLLNSGGVGGNEEIMDGERERRVFFLASLHGREVDQRRLRQVCMSQQLGYQGIGGRL